MTLDALAREQTPQRNAAVVRAPASAAHDVPHHPENQRRLDTIWEYLTTVDMLRGREEIPVEPAPLAIVEQVHNPWYVERLDRLAMGGGAWLDSDTYIGPESYDVALLTAGAAVAAVQAVLEDVVGRAFALGRPPGHHATSERGMGFCLLNNVAIAAAWALEQGLDHVAIVDWDVHHGNGTQDIFYQSDQVLFCSLHQAPFYPGTGSARERGENAGEGLTINIPLAAGKTDADYDAAFDQAVAPSIDAFEPDLILISAGYDAHADDPLGGMRLTDQGFAQMTRRLVDLAERHADGRVVAVLEGGYDPIALARSVAATLAVLDDGDPSGLL
jgi:acetoin utilization deacetylase AcuC-like enzyme